MVKVSDYIIDYISQYTNHVFMLAGGGCMHLVDSLGQHPTLEYVPCLHEQAAVICAEAYAQYTNNLGVCLVTTGPGATNAITGVASAWIDSVPLLVISGQVKIDDLMFNTGLRQKGTQEVDIVTMVNSITKDCLTITNPEYIKTYLPRIIELAMTPRKGPVWLDIPLDIQNAEI